LEQDRQKKELESRQRQEADRRAREEKQKAEEKRVELERFRQEERRKEQERQDRKRREEAQRQEIEKQRREQERARQEQERRRQQQEQQIKQEQEERICQEQQHLEQQRQEEKQRQEHKRQVQLQEQQRRNLMSHNMHGHQQDDLGMARMAAFGALNDLGEEQQVEMQHHYQTNERAIAEQVPSTINFEDLGVFNQNRTDRIKSEPRQVAEMPNQYNAWLNRANELLDLSSGDSRDTPDRGGGNDQEQSSGFIPQILMNPWDPQQPPVMTLAPIANAMQQYQQQWLSQYQQAAGMLGQQQQQQDETDSFPLGKCRVLCIPPDDEMGFLINLPAPCNLLYQPSTIGMSGKPPESPFCLAFQKWMKDPEGAEKLKAEHQKMTEAPDKPPEILPGKKAYMEPYTPKASSATPGTKEQVSKTGFSRAIIVPGQPNRPPKPRPTPATNNRSNSGVSRNNSVKTTITSPRKNTGDNKSRNRSKAQSDDEDAEPAVPIIRESSRRKAKEQASAKRQKQADLLMDDDDPTLNHPALDLDDSDADDDWTPLKEKESQGLKGNRKRGGDSSDEEFNEFEKVNKNFENKKRAYPEPDKINNKRPAPDTQQEQEAAAGEGEDFKVGDFLVLKGEVDDPYSALWRVDGKTLIQKYECFEKANNKYKNVSTYSGWTASTRHKYSNVAVKMVKQSAKETVVIRLGPDAVQEQDKNSKDSKPPESPKSPTKPVNLEEIRQKSVSETSQFQENFEVYMQTLISQCLDANFLNEIFSEQDDYFVTNIEKVDSVTLLRKDKLMTGVSWTLRFQHALTVWPCLNDLGSEACTSTVCGACEKNKAETMLQMFGQPYNSNTLSTIPPDPEAMMNRNFSVCEDCSRLCSLFHKLHHQKQTLYTMCFEIVEKRKTENPGIDTTQILNQLLADDTWLETQFKKMQSLWGDADGYVHAKP